MKDTQAIFGRFNEKNGRNSFYSFLSLLPNPDTILDSKGMELTEYRKLTFDPQVNACISSREAAVKGSEWEIVSPMKTQHDQFILNFIRDQFRRLDTGKLFSEILDAVWMGFSPIETVISTDGRYLTYEKLLGRKSENFAFDTDHNLRFLHKEIPEGIPVKTEGPEKEIELVSHRSKSYNPYGESELARCFWAVHFKKGSLTLWVSFLERFGDDPLFLKVPQGTSGKKINALLNMLEELKSSGAGVFEGDSKPETLGVNKSATSGLFEKLYQMCNMDITKSLLGHSAGTDSTSGKLGSEQTALSVRSDLIAEDKKLIENTMNRLIAWLVDMNFNTKQYPVFRFSNKDHIQMDRAKRDKIITEMGYGFSDEYLRKHYSFEKNDLIPAKEAE